VGIAVHIARGGLGRRDAERGPLLHAEKHLVARREELHNQAPQPMPGRDVDVHILLVARRSERDQLIAARRDAPMRRRQPIARQVAAGDFAVIVSASAERLEQHRGKNAARPKQDAPKSHWKSSLC
jgi:hypothetical protein